MAKRRRILNGFVESQNARQDRGAILKFLRQAMKPEHYLKTPARYEPLRARRNKALAFCRAELLAEDFFHASWRP